MTRDRARVSKRNFFKDAARQTNRMHRASNPDCPHTGEADKYYVQQGQPDNYRALDYDPATDDGYDD